MKKVLIVIVGVVVLLAAIGFILPANYKVVRTVHVKAAPEVIFERVNTLENWKEWMVWIRRDPEMKLNFSGPASGVDATMAWEGKEGSGELTVTESKAPEFITYRLTFPGFPSSTGRVILAASGDGYDVSWSDEGTLGNNPFNRYFGLVLDAMIGKDFEEGLGYLKALAEAAPKPEVPEVETPDAENKDAEGQAPPIVPEAMR